MADGTQEFATSLVGAFAPLEREMGAEGFASTFAEHIVSGATGLAGLELALPAAAEMEACANRASDRVTVAWVARGRHTGEFLGWRRTRQPVVLLVHTVGRREKDGSWSYISRFDSLAALGQLGVLAVGRPLAPLSVDPPPGTPEYADAAGSRRTTVADALGFSFAKEYRVG